MWQDKTRISTKNKNTQYTGNLDEKDKGNLDKQKQQAIEKDFVKSSFGTIL